MQIKCVGKSKSNQAAKGGKTKAVLYREIVFKEAVYPDGLRAILDVRAKCLNPSGQPIPFREGAAIAKARSQAGQLNQPPYPYESTLLTVFQHWPENGLEGKSELLDEIVCVYLNESSNFEPDAARYSLAVRSGQKYEPK